MQNLIIGGVIAMVSGLIVGVITPTINTRMKDQNLKNQLILKLSSFLFLLKNNLKNYLNEDLYIRSISDDTTEEEKRLEYLLNQINLNINNLYSVQQELIIFYKSKLNIINDVYRTLDEIDQFIWTTKAYHNNGKSMFDQESASLYDLELNKLFEEKLQGKINYLINLNIKTLNLQIKHER